LTIEMGQDEDRNGSGWRSRRIETSWRLRQTGSGQRSR